MSLNPLVTLKQPKQESVQTRWKRKKKRKKKGRKIGRKEGKKKGGRAKFLVHEKKKKPAKRHS